MTVAIIDAVKREVYQSPSSDTRRFLGAVEEPSVS
jgi:hypothetical protein